MNHDRNAAGAGNRAEMGFRLIRVGSVRDARQNQQPIGAGFRRRLGQQTGFARRGVGDRHQNGDSLARHSQGRFHDLGLFEHVEGRAFAQRCGDDKSVHSGLELQGIAALHLGDVELIPGSEFCRNGRENSLPAFHFVPNKPPVSCQ